MSRSLWLAGIVGTLAACASVPLPPPPSPATPDAAIVVPAEAPPPLEPPAVPPVAGAGEAGVAADALPLPSPIQQEASRWQPVRWSDLPGWGEDSLHEAWNAWIRSCERPAEPWGALCIQVRPLSIASASQQRAWMEQHLQPYRVEPLGAPGPGLLTAYYEPVLEASRQPTDEFKVALHAPPAGLAARRPWFSRQEIDTLAEARAALQGREIAWLADPLDALILHIQGSGRLWIREPDGRRRMVRLAFAGTNEQPYRSVGAWLLAQGALRDASWPGIKAWAQAHPARLQEMLWSNPRVVFFREEQLDDLDAAAGPRGAQGVALTPGRSIAVDRRSIPYGTPVWLTSPGPTLALRRLVLAQDTGSAIVGAVRADYFVGWGDAAGEIAGRVKQPLALWVLWPRAAPQR